MFEAMSRCKKRGWVNVRLEDASWCVLGKLVVLWQRSRSVVFGGGERVVDRVVVRGDNVWPVGAHGVCRGEGGGGGLPPGRDVTWEADRSHRGAETYLQD